MTPIQTTLLPSYTAHSSEACHEGPRQVVQSSRTHYVADGLLLADGAIGRRLCPLDWYVLE
jgi:hypothetical protein